MSRRAVSPALSIDGVQTRKSASSGCAASTPCNWRTGSGCLLIAGMRIGHGRSANITIREFDFVADTTEPSLEATT
jgi:hypothetical protein